MTQKEENHLAYQPKRCRRRRRRRPSLRLPVAVLLLVLTLTGSWTLLSAHVSAQHDTDTARHKAGRRPAAIETVVPAAPPETPTATLPPETPPVETEPAGEYDYAAPVPEREAVEDDWFADAAFLGDSLTDGLLLYSGLQGGENLSYKGMTVQSVRTDAVIRMDGGKCTPLEALGRKTYGKVYLLLGVNELGWYNDQRFYDCYAQLVDLVREIQPNAQIYLQTLLPVTAEKSQNHEWLKNEKVAVYNDLIAQLAEEKEVYLLDTHAALADENGVLPAEESTDGVHLTRSGYEKWAAYLRGHTVSPGNP